MISIMKEWKKLKIEELCLKVTSGGTPLRKKTEYYTGNIPWIKTGELKGWYIYDTDEMITDDAIENSSAKLYPTDTILMAMYGDGRTIGSVGITGVEAASNQACCAMIPNKTKCDPYFLLFALKNYSNELVNLALGGAQRNLNQRTIREFEINVPNIDVQQRIGEQLSNFNQLIENNTRRIAILEEMARLIYREWFVHYRYPGNENDNLVDSGTELGEVPEGWGVKSLEDLCELIVGQSPKSEFYNGIGDGLPFHQGVKDFGNRFPTTTTWCTVQKRIAEKGDILFSVRAPVGRINIANCKMIIGRGLHAIRSKTGNQVFIFEQLKDKFQEEDSMGSGTIYKSVTKGDMLGLKFKYPGKNLIEQFEEKAEPIFDQIRILTEKNIYLKETRDLLLPKLISGMVGV